MLPQHDTQAARVMPLQETTMTFQRIQVEPLTPTIGATVTGVDLNRIDDPAGPMRATADTGAVTLIQRFGSAANLNIHLHCLVLDGVYRRTGGEPVFQQARAPTGDELADLLDKIIARLLKAPGATAPRTS